MKTEEIKKILTELTKAVKNLRKGTDCGGDFKKEECKGCKDYFACLETQTHQENCTKIQGMIEKL